MPYQVKTIDGCGSELLSYWANRISLLIFEKESYNKLPRKVWARCAKYVLCDAILRIRNFKTSIWHNAFATKKFCKPKLFKIVHPKSWNVHK